MIAITSILILMISTTTGQICEMKQFAYKQTTLCTGIKEKFPASTNLQRPLQCIDCNLPNISDDTLKSFRGDSFNISGCKVQVLTETAFKSFWPTVKTFILSNNQISEVPKDIFKRFTGLREIHLQHNNISKLPENQFEKVSVNVMDLSWNNLTDIWGAFNGLTTQVLNVSNNRLGKIPVNAFVNMSIRKDFSPDFESILLQNNAIAEVFNGSFRFKGTMRTLNLQDNMLTRLENGTFAQLNTLQQLYLKNNRIKYLEANSFTGLTSLNYLDLANNRLDSIPFGLFASLQQLRTLILKNNLIKAIQTTSFSGLINLYKLDISDNALKKLDDSCIFPLGKLSYLDISNNRLQEMEIESILNHHTNLRSLNINNNFWTCNDLVVMYKWLNRKMGGFINPSNYYNVPNLHGIACSRILFEVSDGMSFEEFLKVISQDMVLEDLYDVRITPEDNQLLNSRMVKYLRDMFYMQLIITTIIVVTILAVACLCLGSLFEKNHVAQRLKFFYNNRGDNIELLT